VTTVPLGPSRARGPTRSVGLRLATVAIVALHLGLLIASLPDYRVSSDAAFHTALGRQYGEHVVYFWDAVHYAPAGRPNLQGPGVHFLIGMLGRALGGSGDAYVRANALLGIACWLAAVATVAFFARRWGGDRAMLLGVATFSGSAFAAGSFYVNLPSGWMFVLVPWAIHFFVERHLALASIVTALACYTHLGGFATAPLGVAFVALLTRRWRDLAVTGLAVAVLTAPYWIHFLLSLGYYVGQKGDTAWLIDPLVNLSWLVGLVFVLSAPRRRAFLAAWIAAPVVWLFQDPTRFILQSSLAGAAVGGVAVAAFVDARRRRGLRVAVTTVLVVLATVFPLGAPGLGGEISWLFMPYPRMLDWSEMRADAEVIRRDGLEDRLLWGYSSYVPSAIAVWANTRGEKGHWVEVQPPVDPAQAMSVGEKTFLLPAPAADGTFAAWQEKGLVRVHGGGRWSAVLTFERRPSVEEATEVARAAWAEDAAWIARNCERNALGDWVDIFTDPREIPRRRRERGYCRTRIAHMAGAMLLYSYAYEGSDPARASLAAEAARGLGWTAALVGDEATLDFRTVRAHEQMREDMAAVAEAARTGVGIDEAFVRLIENVAGGARGGLAGRSAATARVRALRDGLSAAPGPPPPASTPRD
jgi:hypothetical protein